MLRAGSESLHAMNQAPTDPSSDPAHAPPALSSPPPATPSDGAAAHPAGTAPAAAAAAVGLAARPFPVLLGLLVLLSVYQFLFGRFFPNTAGRIGHDYSGVLPQLLAGEYWFHASGALAVPWFTPAFCGGVPYFADPQSMYYSAAQWLSFVTDPLRAIQISLFLFAAAGFGGMYLFCRRLLNASREAAFAAAAVFMFNGFYGFRMVVGHVNFHSFMLLPWLALVLGDGLLSRPATPPPAAAGLRRDALQAVHVALILAYMLHAGLGSLILAGGLAVLLLLLLASLLQEGLHWGRLILRGVAGAVGAAGISAAHLAVSFALMSHFPRADYRLPGFASLLDSALIAGRALFLPGGAIAEAGAEVLVNGQWALGRHEYEYGVGPVPLLALLLLVFAAWREWSVRLRPTGPAGFPWRRLQWAALLLLVLLPLALNTFQEDWNHLLKQTPVLSSSSTLIRWFLVYVPALAAVCAPAIDRFPLPRRAMLAVGACLLTVGALALTDTSDYQNEPYPPRRILIGHQRLAATGLVPPVANLVEPMNDQGMIQRNDALVEGSSTIHCYDPTFGYRLEHLPVRDMHLGPTDSILGEGEDAHYNLKNPACYAFPGENQCTPGDHFKVSQKDLAREFASYRPFPFVMSSQQQGANQISLWSLCLLVLVEAGFAVRWLLSLRRRVGSAPAPQPARAAAD